MNNLERFPEKIYIEESSQDYPLTKSILNKLTQVPFEVISDPQGLLEEIGRQGDPVGEGKKYLYITQQKGEFVKSCPCTPHYVGCDYYIINLDLNCPLDCTYCILQQYLSNPVITVHANTDDLWSQLDSFLKKKRSRCLRIGTGELGDSLVLDPITERSRDLVAYFRTKPHAILELKTKTTNIENVMEVGPAENVVIAWSLNAKKIADTEEINAPSVGERILAAQTVMKRGYRVAFHFDPIIRFPGWEEGYTEVVTELLGKIPAAKIAWISLGSLRFPSQLKTIIQQRFPETNLIYEEFIPGVDGKFRYFKPIRVELYKKLVTLIQKDMGDAVPLYFCMESQEIWREVLKKEPRGKEEVGKFLSSPLGCCQ